MDKNTSRQKVMGNVRKALMANPREKKSDDIDFSNNVYKPFSDTKDVVFAEEFSKAGGEFFYCESVVDFQKNLKALFDDRGWEHIFCIDKNLQKLLKEAKVPFKHGDTLIPKSDVGITRCEYLIARFGSVMVSSKGGSGRRLNAFPDTHIVMAYSTQVVGDIKEAMEHMKQKYSTGLPSVISTITGPSRTADIEKTLVMGAHGPRELIVFFIDL